MYRFIKAKNVTNYFQQIIFPGKLEEVDGAAMFFIAEKQQKIILNFLLFIFFISQMILNS